MASSEDPPVPVGQTPWGPRALHPATQADAVQPTVFGPRELLSVILYVLAGVAAIVGASLTWGVTGGCFAFAIVTMPVAVLLGLGDQ